jgi:hypothetical protein
MTIGTALRVVSVVLMVVFFAIGVVKGPKQELIDHLLRAAAAGGIPSALVLLWDAADPSILCKVSGLELPVVFGGLSLLYVSVKHAFKN